MLKELEGPGTYSKQQTQLSSQKDLTFKAYWTQFLLPNASIESWFQHKTTSYSKRQRKKKNLKSQSKYQNQIQK